MTTQTIKLITFGLYGSNRAARRSGVLAKGRTEVLDNLGGNTLRCTSGSLWVTLEGDSKDYVLAANQTLAIPTPGKILVSGAGTYQV
jgi:hypothetical protein